MSIHDTREIGNVKVVMLKGEKGEKGDGSYDDTEIRALLTSEAQERASEITALEISKADKTALETEKTRIDAEKARIDNLVTSIGEKGETTLWTGTGYYRGQTLTLSENISNYDYLDIYSYDRGRNVIKTIPVSLSNSVVLRNTNVPDYGTSPTSTDFSVSEMHLQFSGTTCTIADAEMISQNQGVGTRIVIEESTSTSSVMRIDKIVGRTVTANNTELTDIRVGADGTAYQTAGEAVRGQVRQLNGEIGDLQDYFNNRVSFDATEWVLGTLNPGTGTQGTSTTRIVSPYIEVSQNEIITYSGNTNCLVVYEFDTNKGYISDSPWSYGNKYKVTHSNAKYVRILIRKDSSNTTISNSDIDGLVAGVSLYKVIPKEVYEIDDIIADVDYLKNLFNISEPVFTDGYYINYTNGAFVVASGYSYATANVSLFRGGNIKGRTAVAPNTGQGIAFYDSFDNYISGVNSTNTGHYDFEYDLTVPENAEYVRITLRQASASFWTDIEYPWNVVLGNIQTQYTDLERNEKEVIENNENARHIKGKTSIPLTLLHFSDLHGDKLALGRITEYANKMHNSIDDMICTGDIVSNTAEEITSWWNENVLTCIGNHDSAIYNTSTGYNWTALSMANRDSYYIAPFESKWGIVHISGTSYYYKDYANQKVRFIVMDAMLYSSFESDTSLGTAQTAWLANLLANAITNNLHVLIAIHAPHDGAVAKECSFSRYGQTAMPLWSDCNTPQSVIDTVASAITNGLHFIGYIVGHTHQDNIWDAENNGKQLMYCVTCANVLNANQWKNSDQNRKTADAYNLITIDTENTLVKIVRGGGANIDDHMRTRKAICFNYSTGEKVGEVL
jgi:hypothetical protein